MRRLSLGLIISAAALVTAGPASAQPNPYTPGKACGAGYSVVRSHPMTANSNHNVLLATSYLLYNRSTGNNCAVTMKNRAIGRATYTTATIKKKSGNPYDAITDHGYFKYFAGPVYVHAVRTCVKYGAAVSQPVGRAFNPSYFATFYSRFTACT